MIMEAGEVSTNCTETGLRERHNALSSHPSNTLNNLLQKRDHRFGCLDWREAMHSLRLKRLLWIGPAMPESEETDE